MLTSRSFRSFADHPMSLSRTLRLKTGSPSAKIPNQLFVVVVPNEIPHPPTEAEGNWHRPSQGSQGEKYRHERRAAAPG